MGFIFFIVIVQGILVAMLCSYVAGQKNRSKGNWFFLGFFFSLLALIALAAIPSLSKEQAKPADSSSLNPPDSPDTRKCPFCAEIVKIEAKVCKHCRSDLPEYKAESNDSVNSEKLQEEKLAREKAEHKKEKQLLEKYSMGHQLNSDEMNFLKRRGITI